MVRLIIEKLHLNGDVAKHIVGAYITFAETSGIAAISMDFTEGLQYARPTPTSGGRPCSLKSWISFGYLRKKTGTDFLDAPT